MEIKTMPVSREAADQSGVLAYYWSDIEFGGKQYAYKIAMKIGELQGVPSGNAYMQLKEWKKLGDMMIKYINSVGSYVRTTREMMERIETDSEAKRYQRWSPEEDEILIELVCSGEKMPMVSAYMGRTVPAIKTRVSKLVGTKRISQKVAGRFIGTFNGESVDGMIDGTLYETQE